LRNIHYSVYVREYERKYISSDPCKFIQGGMIERGLYQLQDIWDFNSGDIDQKKYQNPDNFNNN